MIDWGFVLTCGEVPLISVVVPCFNVESSILRCLESLRAQSFRQNYEIVCVDDGSSDKTLPILRSIALLDERVLVYSKDNDGAYSTRLYGARKARGKYLAFVDGDDVVSPDYLQNMFDCAEMNLCDLVVCGFSRVLAGSGSVLSNEFCVPRIRTNVFDNPMDLVEINPAPWNKLFRTSVFNSIEPIRPYPIMFDDLIMLLQYYGHFNGIVAYCPNPLIGYMIHEGSSINSVKPDQIDSAMSALETIRNSYDEAKNTRKLLPSLSVMAFVHLVVSMSFRLTSSGCSLNDYVKSSRGFLNRVFPGWNNNDCFSLTFAIKKRGIFLKAYICFVLLKTGLFSGAIRLYALMLKFIGKTVSW